MHLKAHSNFFSLCSFTRHRFVAFKLKIEKIPSSDRLICGFTQHIWYRIDKISQIIKFRYKKKYTPNRNKTAVYSYLRLEKYETLFTCVKCHFLMFLYAYMHTHSNGICHFVTAFLCAYACVRVNMYVPCGGIGSVDSTCVIWLIEIVMLAYVEIWAVRCKNHWNSFLCLSIAANTSFWQLFRSFFVSVTLYLWWNENTLKSTWISCRSSKVVNNKIQHHSIGLFIQVSQFAVYYIFFSCSVSCWNMYYLRIIGIYFNFAI